MPQVQQESLKSLQPRNLREFNVWQRERKEHSRFKKGKGQNPADEVIVLVLFQGPKGWSLSQQLDWPALGWDWALLCSHTDHYQPTQAWFSPATW